ncbi:MAG: DNA polymerase IV [Alphaproteobacteria bacterium]
MSVPSLCRDCGSAKEPLKERCRDCGSPRLRRHPDLHRLSIAHLDCDAFYATVEKRDDPSLRDRPVIVGGEHRGVVSACCYIARMYGVRSAMPMFKARRLCPEAVVIRPDMRKYSSVGKEVRALMLEVTPLVEPLSIDEAFLDLSGTEKLHGASPATTLARLVLRIEHTIGITASVGLSYNKFLAKLASDLDKPRGFAVIGPDEALDFLSDRPVTILWGVGPSLARRLREDGIALVRDIRTVPEDRLVARYGSIGRRLAHLARGEDNRRVDPDAPTKSISAETTFDRDLKDRRALEHELWPLCETVARRLKRSALAGQSITLKLKDTDFQIRTRSRRLASPTQLADVIYRHALPLLEREADGTAFRLIGIGAGSLTSDRQADPPDLLDPEAQRRARAERAVDEVRDRLGPASIIKGRSLP